MTGRAMWFRSKPGKHGRPQSTPTKNIEPARLQAESRLQRARLPVDLLQPGMRVVKLDRPWTEVPVLFQGFTLATDSEARVLRQYCNWVLVEDEEIRLMPVLDQIPSLKQRTNEPLAETRALREEMPRAAQAWSRTHQFIEQTIRNIEQHNDLQLETARPLIRDCVNSVKANASAMLWLARIKDRDSYTAEHCLRVAIFTVAFARFVGLPDDELEVAGLCGLLHDIGKLKVPDRILNKPGPLTPEEYAVMQEHTILGHQLLLQDPGLDRIISDVTLHHHERMDGQGYPGRLNEYQISRFARLVAIVDAYDAMTSDRCYRDAISPAEAARMLYRNRGDQFDADLVEAFIRLIGIYPPGSLVELNTGEIALVISTHPARKLRPKVEILLNADKRPLTPQVIDLGKQTTEGNTVREIHAPLPDGAYDVSLQERIRQLMAKPDDNAS
ncbi:HD-GYP domain-containing protein [Marinobacter halophilus]|nr:HD-GYP domain-containing protein [Marinobacter halophilus]